MSADAGDGAAEARLLGRIDIDGASLRAASALQAVEWRLLLEELGRAELRGDAPVEALVVERTDAFARLRLEGSSGVLRVVEIGTPMVLSLFDEYAGTVRQMMDGSLPLPRLEALDMAKKVVHDRAGRTLRGLLPELTGDLEAFRRLFSLVVAMRVDPSEMSRARRHG
ncbi:MAG: UPF0262 family protein [Polyangiaceae bacterium]